MRSCSRNDFSFNNMNKGLKFTVKKSKTGVDIVDSLLYSRGIEDIKTFKNVLYEDIHVTDPFKFYNMRRAVQQLRMHIRNGSKIGILADGDADGFVSTAILYGWLIENYNKENVELIVLPFKSHGLLNALSTIVDTDIDLLFVPDAGSNDFQLQNELFHQYDIDTIVIDHHEIDDQEMVDEVTAIIVNNQLVKNEETNKNFVGSGMVLKFIEAAEKFENPNSTNYLKYLSAVAIGQIGDGSDVADLEIRKMMLYGFHNIQNEMMKLMFVNTEADDLSPHEMSFSIIPKINAIARIGEYEERVELIKCLANYYDVADTVVVERRRKNYTTGKMEKKQLEWSHYELEIDLMAKIKSRQDSAVKKAMEIFDEETYHSKLTTIAIADESELQYGGITGLIANKFLSKYERTALLLVRKQQKNSEKDVVLYGSGRGLEKIMPDFRKFCNESGLFKLAQGHGNAFGVELEEKNVQKLVEYIDNYDIEFDPNYEIDRIYDAKTATKEDIASINQAKPLFGGKVSEPMFGYVGLPISRKNIKNRGNMVTIHYNGISFVKFNGADILEEIRNSGFQSEFIFDVYGSPSESSWGDPEQIIINDIAYGDIETPEDSYDQPEGYELRESGGEVEIIF